MLATAAVILALALAGGIDYVVTAAEAPKGPRSFGETTRLGNDLENRSWAYAGAGILALIVGIGITWRRTPSTERREIFTDIGVGAVAWLIASVTLGMISADDAIEPPTEAMLVFGGASVLIAGAGTLVTRLDAFGAADETAPAEISGADRLVRKAGILLTLAAAVLALSVLASRGDPCSSDYDDWHDVLLSVVGMSALGAVICGLVELIRRRWMAALAMLTVGPFAALVAAFSVACFD